LWIILQPKTTHPTVLQQQFGGTLEHHKWLLQQQPIIKKVGSHTHFFAPRDFLKREVEGGIGKPQLPLWELGECLRETSLQYSALLKKLCLSSKLAFLLKLAHNEEADKNLVPRKKWKP